MQVLIREITTRSDGEREFRDRDFDGDALSIGSAPDQTIQVIGRGIIGHHAILTKSRDGLSLRCRRGARVQVGDDLNVTKAELNPGTSIEISGNRVTLIDAPGGFDAAITVELNTEVEASEFEAAFVTDLQQTWLGKRSPAWWLAMAVVILGLLVPWFLPRDNLPELMSDALWSSGPLLPAHSVAIGNDCGACHRQSFQKVRDTECVACHVSMTNHASEPLFSHVGLAEIRCATCHKEHNEPVHMTITADALCIDCHSEPDSANIQLASVSGFGPMIHPSFSADLLVADPVAQGTGLVYQWRPETQYLDQAVERSNLKYPHDIHLDADKVQDLATGEALGCHDCHTLSADDEHFELITMERHCRACHDLKFDRRAPDRELPHGDPAEVVLAMEGHYSRMYADPNANQQANARRRLPGRATERDRCSEPIHICAQRRTAQEADNQFTKRGCVTCHEVVVHDSEDLLARYQVVPVRLTPDFFVAAEFDHRAHLTQEGASGDGACQLCHKANRSSSSRDVLLPDINQCTSCHSDHRSSELIPLHCVDCHAFHPDARYVQAQPTIDAVAEYGGQAE
ncbi:MAG: hypothetical protein VB948_00235 [Pseudomonadales bacterium]